MTTVNKEEKFIYIHIPKCAGSSIERVDWLGGAGHVTYKHLQNKLNMKEYFVFTSIRNPFDRFVSAYFHFVQYPLKKNESQADQDCYTYIKNHHAKYKDSLRKGFPEFLDGFPNKLFKINHFKPQRFFIENKNGNVNLDYIMRVDSLQKDFDVVCDKLGKSRLELPHNKKSNHLPFIQYYTPELLVKLDKMYKLDIELYTSIKGS